MHMIRLFCFLLFCGSGLSVAAQSHHASIHAVFQQYHQLTIDKDYSGLMDYIYPKMFSLVPREQMVAVFEQMDGEEMSFDFHGMQLDSISEIFVYDGEQFAMVDYTGEMTLWMLSEAMQDSLTMDFMEATMALTYEEVERVDKDGTPGFALRFHKKMYAIAPTDSEDWKFIENKAEQGEIMKMLFSRKVIEHFNPALIEK